MLEDSEDDMFKEDYEEKTQEIQAAEFIALVKDLHKTVKSVQSEMKSLTKESKKLRDRVDEVEKRSDKSGNSSVE
jgi:regulator of replication initiation timing